MTQIIVGHTDAHSTRIWVRGRRAGYCSVTLSRNSVAPEMQSKQIHLGRESDFTGVAVFDGLRPNTQYAITARFEAQSGEEAAGRVRTLRNDAVHDFGFVLSSCNLSVVAVNNLLSLGLGLGGAWAAMSSLKLPKDRWQGLWRWLPFAAFVLKLFVGLAGLVRRATGLKQPGPPFLRSPFLKLAAVFDSQILELTLDKIGESIPLSTGDIVRVDEVRAVAASMPAWKDQGKGVIEVVVAQASGTFPPGEGAPVWFERRGVLASSEKSNGKESDRVGRQKACRDALPWYGGSSENLAFFLHAGDQIYYDFPLPARKPEKAQYWLAYRESWSDDEALRYVLSHWPHYMTFDDHEFADQFSLDFVPPADSKAADYLREGEAAYQNYVHGRNPPTPDNPKHYFYSYSVGAAHFFVLDTRTERYIGSEEYSPQMIGSGQMVALRQWLLAHRADLKFVVTSVPFVAECKEDDGEAESVSTWYGYIEPKREDMSQRDNKRNRRNDKWSAPSFRPQREEIIDFIASEGIERVVFLTGDVHCCYHASMRIAARKKKDGSQSEIQQDSHAGKYESVVVHELAAGPVNQLELGQITSFMPRYKGVTSNGVLYEIVLDRFHTEANAVMHIAVAYHQRDRIVTEEDRRLAPEIVWNVIRTITDCGPEVWTPMEAQKDRGNEPVMAGRIVFTPQRTQEKLLDWVQQS